MRVPQIEPKSTRARHEDKRLLESFSRHFFVKRPGPVRQIEVHRASQAAVQAVDRTSTVEHGPRPGPPCGPGRAAEPVLTIFQNTCEPGKLFRFRPAVLKSWMRSFVFVGDTGSWPLLSPMHRAPA